MGRLLEIHSGVTVSYIILKNRLTFGKVIAEIKSVQFLKDSVFIHCLFCRDRQSHHYCRRATKHRLVQ